MTSAPVVTAFIVEDEALARRRLRDLVRGVPWLDFVGEAATGPSAIAAIDRTSRISCFSTSGSQGGRGSTCWLA